ncbi:MAG TPA: hypothetical protein VFQ13_25205 [Anaerolineales bacterium]|nr:hypothetical protein [Anaerolineales bacterium]
MRKLFFPVFFACLFIIILMSGCTTGQTRLLLSPIPPTATPLPTRTPVPTSTSMSISVLPFYDSQGTQIQVGEYSEQLKTDDLQLLTAMAQEMAQQKEILTPEQMYVLAIRLYDLGDKDNSIYWYYEAQFRARLFQQAIEPAQYININDRTFELTTAYDSFQKLAGEYINGYAGCNLDNWVKFTKMVKDDNPVPPELHKIFPDVIFVKQEQWQAINDEVSVGLGKLIDYISENGETIKQQRAQQNMDSQFCN